MNNKILLNVKNYDRKRQSSDETDCSTSSKKRKNMKGNTIFH